MARRMVVGIVWFDLAELLRRLGYAVDLLSCRTLEPEKGRLSANFDHLTLLVHLDGARYLVDVGWGDN